MGKTNIKSKNFLIAPEFLFGLIDDATRDPNSPSTQVCVCANKLLNHLLTEPIPPSRVNPPLGPYSTMHSNARVAGLPIFKELACFDFAEAALDM